VDAQERVQVSRPLVPPEGPQAGCMCRMLDVSMYVLQHAQMITGLSMTPMCAHSSATGPAWPEATVDQQSPAWLLRMWGPAVVSVIL
jgi:hypothetical protein